MTVIMILIRMTLKVTSPLHQPHSMSFAAVSLNYHYDFYEDKMTVTVMTMIMVMLVMLLMMTLKVTPNSPHST